MVFCHAGNVPGYETTPAGMRQSTMYMMSDTLNGSFVCYGPSFMLAAAANKVCKSWKTNVDNLKVDYTENVSAFV